MTNGYRLARPTYYFPRIAVRLFLPTETLSMFFAEAINTECSCPRAVNPTALNRAATSLLKRSTHAATYC